MSFPDPEHHPAVPLERLRGMERSRARRAVAIAVARAVGAAVLLMVAYALMPLAALSDVELVLRIAVAGVLIVAIVGWEVWAVNRAHLPQLRALEALVVTVSIVVIAFASAYLNLSRHHPGAFTEPLGKTSALYFTLTTLATVGYGDIAAKTDTARIFVMVQMVANVVVIGSAVKLIIGTARFRLTTPRSPLEPRGPSGEPSTGG